MKNEYIVVNRTALEKRIEELVLLKRINCYTIKEPLKLWKEQK